MSIQLLKHFPKLDFLFAVFIMAIFGGVWGMMIGAVIGGRTLMLLLGPIGSIIGICYFFNYYFGDNKKINLR